MGSHRDGGGGGGGCAVGTGTGTAAGAGGCVKVAGDCVVNVPGDSSALVDGGVTAPVNTRFMSSPLHWNTSMYRCFLP